MNTAGLRPRVLGFLLGAGVWASLGGELPAANLNSSPANPFPPALSARPWQRRALVTGRGEPFTDQGGPTHAEIARRYFLRAVGNPGNEPAKGWTCDMSWDLMVKFGMNPTNTPLEVLLDYLGQHQLGYRIVINNVARGQRSPAWSRAAANGLMAFAPHGNNTPKFRFDDPTGIGTCVGVGGGGPGGNLLTYGQSLEFHDALPVGWHWNTNAVDPAQSWANQQVAAKFARILDAHPAYNIWDARQHLRQAANRWPAGWTEREGYGWVDERVVVKKLEPGAPVAFTASLSRDRHHVHFSWENFLMTDFAATVIARADGTILYEGTGTNFSWLSDRDGEVSFRYWSKNRAGKRSRHETCHVRTVGGLLAPWRNYTALLLGLPTTNDYTSEPLRQRFRSVATNWQCDLVVVSGTSYYDTLTNFPHGDVVAVKSNYTAMVDFAIAAHYRILLVPMLPMLRVDLAQFQTEWDRAAAAGLLVMLPHQNFFDFTNRTVRVTPARLSSAVSVGPAVPGDRRASGSGLEFLDETPQSGPMVSPADSNQSAALVAGKLARLLETHPAYNIWDARQHLRQVSTNYLQGWREQGGYGQVPSGALPEVPRLDLAPPFHFTASRSADGRSVNFAWELFRQTALAEVVLQREGGAEIYRGSGTNFTWTSTLQGDATFTLRARSKTGELSRLESYCRVSLAGLVDR